MDFIKFITFCNNYDFGVAAFNTYRVGNGIFCYLMISQKGLAGQFYKIECLLCDLDNELDKLSKVIKRRTFTFLIKR